MSRTAIAARIHELIHTVRGQRVMFDEDLAQLYGTTTKRLNQAVKRSRARFPAEFAFQLSAAEWAALKSQIVTAKRGRGGRRNAPRAFTEYGALMLANVLSSPRAVAASVQVVRAFVRMREFVLGNRELSKQLAELERSVDARFAVVFDTLRQLMEPPADDHAERKRIGFKST